MPRPPRPDDLYRLRVPTGRACRPTAARVVTLKTVAPGFDGYRHALWLVPTDGAGEPRQLTIGAKNDWHARLSPGRPDARLPLRPTRRSSRRSPPAPQGLEGPRGRRPGPPVAGRWRRGPAPDRPAARCQRLRMVARRHAARRRQHVARRDPTSRTTEAAGIDARAKPGAPPESDYRFVDRLDYMLNGDGFTYDRVGAPVARRRATGEATRLTDGPTRRRARLVAGRDAHRLRGEPPPRRRPALPVRPPRRRRRVGRRHGRHRAARARSSTADVAARRRDARRARQPAPGRRGLPQRHLALRR